MPVLEVITLTEIYIFLLLNCLLGHLWLENVKKQTSNYQLLELFPQYGMLIFCTKVYIHFFIDLRLLVFRKNQVLGILQRKFDWGGKGEVQHGEVKICTCIFIAVSLTV